MLAAAAPAWAAPPTSRALLLQGDRYAAQGKWDSARAAYVRAIEAGAVLDQDYLRCRNLGRAYMNGKDPDYAEAAKWLARALELRPNAQDLRPLLARSQAESGDYKSAAEQYGVLAKAQPNNSKYRLAWADALVHEGEAGQAAAAVEDYMGKHPADKATRLDFARMLTYDRSNFDEAIRQYQAVLSADPNNLIAQVGVAKIMSWQDRLDISLELYDKVLARDPQNYDAIVGKAFTLMWMERKDEAHQLFEAAAARNPNDREVASALLSLEAAPPPPPAPPAPPPVDLKAAEKAYLDTLMAAGAEAAARGNFVEAIHEYHRVLERDPNNLAAKLQIARVLSWSKNYQEAAQQYDEVLSTRPTDAGVRLEKARVLSWAKLFPQSISEYERVLKDAGPDSGLNRNDVRLEYARVLSWAGRYEDSLAQFDLLLPQDAKPEPKDKDALLEKAKVLAYAKHFDRAITTYDQALSVAPGDQDVLLNKGQTLYWAGHLDEAEATLSPLLQEQTKQPETSFVLAEVERGRGNNSRALNLLEAAPQNEDTIKLRTGIRTELRPVLHLRYGYEDDREVSPLVGPTACPLPTCDSTYRAHRYTAGLEFYPHPSVRMEVFNTVTDTDTSNATLARHGVDGLATETMARFDFRINRWLRMVAGAGGGTTGVGTVCPLPLVAGCTLTGQSNRQQQFLYELHPIITHGNLRVDLVSTRRLAEYTALAIHDNVVMRRESAAVTYTWRKRLMMGAEYWHGTYSLFSPDVSLPARSFEVSADGGSAYVRPVLYQNDKVTVDAGFRLDAFGFEDRVSYMASQLVSGGFFAPQRLERYAGTAHIGWDPNPHVRLDFNGSVGPQRVTGFRIGSISTGPPTEALCSAVPTTSGCPPPPQFAISGSGGVELGLKFGRWRPYAAYYFFTTNSPAGITGSGAFQSHTFFVGLRVRF